jgi:CRISPR-associated protein Csm1
MVVNIKEYRTIVLAALLHDIGKLLQRGSFGELDIKGKHPAVSADFIRAFSECFEDVADTPTLTTLVQKHHESHYFEPELNVASISDKHLRTLASLVSLADNLSSAERGDRATTYQDYKETPLASVLERVNNPEKAVPAVRYHASSLNTPAALNSIFPEPFQTYGKGELTNLIQAFGGEFSRLFKTGAHLVNRADFDCLITHLYSLLAKYAWCLPSDTQESFPDVSLFDHLRTTAAIASCLYLYHEEQDSLNESELRSGYSERFLLLTGDVSGIQNYIFDIATTGVGGVARRLRARSFYVQVCNEVASHLILRSVGLPICIHTLINSGGHFYLLLPNTDQFLHRIEQSQKEMDAWFLGKLNGEMAINLAAVAFGDEGFETGVEGIGFGAIVKSVNEKLEMKKASRFASTLLNNGAWSEASFVIPADYRGEESCQSCRKFPQVRQDLCARCLQDREIGRLIPQAKQVSFYEDEKAGEIELFGHSVSINTISKDTAPYLVAKVNDTDLSDITAYPAVFKYTAKTVPDADDCEVCREENSSIATFECLSRRAKGSLLGFLKMDVDSLGEAVIFGLKPNDSISRVSSFSRMLDTFFAAWIENIASRKKSIYTVFSGGDDLFLVGPWDLILDTAELIRNDFQRYTNNNSLSISAGVTIRPSNYPIAAASDEAKSALRQSKEAGKNRVTVLGNTVTWEDWKLVRGELSRLREANEESKIQSTIVYDLLEFAEMWQRYRKQRDILGLRYHPLLTYNLRRNTNPIKSPKLVEWINRLLSIKPGDRQQHFLLDNLGLIGQLLILSTRGGA